MKTLVKPYTTEGMVSQVFSDPKKTGQPEINRAYETTLKGDGKEFSIGIKDIDEAVEYYFKNTLKLSVEQNGTLVPIPILYGNMENWKSFQRDGYYRDKEGKLLAPLLMFKRTSITQNRDLGFKLDGNNAQNVQLFERGFSKRNVYSNFAVLNNRKPEKEYSVVVTPDYVTIEYECVVWTYFMEQMDKLIESLNFSSRAYWGDPNRFQFYTSIETFTDSTEYAQGEDRAVRTSFNMTLNGYLIPNTLNKKIAATSKTFGTTKIVFGIETTDSPLETFALSSNKKQKSIGSTIVADSNNIVNNITNISIGSEAISFLNKSVSKKADIVTAPNTAVFTGALIEQPPAGYGLPPTTKESFTYFINGQFVPPSVITLIQNPGNTTITFDVVLLEYSLESDDEVIMIGKWQ